MSDNDIDSGGSLSSMNLATPNARSWSWNVLKSSGTNPGNLFSLYMFMFLIVSGTIIYWYHAKEFCSFRCRFKLAMAGGSGGAFGDSSVFFGSIVSKEYTYVYIYICIM